MEKLKHISELLKESQSKRRNKSLMFSDSRALALTKEFSLKECPISLEPEPQESTYDFVKNFQKAASLMLLRAQLREADGQKNKRLMMRSTFPKKEKHEQDDVGE